MKRTLLFPLLLAPLIAAEVVQLDSGVIEGTRAPKSGVRIFKGIPFAAKPVGALRWRPPQAPPRWTGLRKADQFAPSCPQPARTGGAALVGTGRRLGPTNEDCLYLNVWTAAQNPSARLPVMVWFPGGGFTTGGGSALVFDGEQLATKGVIVVTTNYRLGVLGFFAYAELTAESDHHFSGNYGLLDQIAVLQWVRKNISAFGGDPDQVTIFGQSAGATSVSYLMASPLAKGLFQRAIGESGGGTGGISAFDPTLKLHEAEMIGAEMAQSLGARSLAQLRAIPADELILKVEGSGNDGGSVGTGPIVDGWVIPEDVGVIFRRGNQSGVPLLVGSAADDGNRARAMPADKYIDESRTVFGSVFDSYIKLYPTGDQDTMRRLSSDTMAWRVWTWAKTQVQAGISDVYLYYFTRGAPPDSPAPGRAYHGAELYYVFRNLNLFDWQWEGRDRDLENIISSYWINFAIHGNPNGQNLPEWARYTAAQSDRVMMLGDKLEMGPTRLDKAKIALFDAYYAALLSR